MELKKAKGLSQHELETRAIVDEASPGASAQNTNNRVELRTQEVTVIISSFHFYQLSIFN